MTSASKSNSKESFIEYLITKFKQKDYWLPIKDSDDLFNIKLGVLVKLPKVVNVREFSAENSSNYIKSIYGENLSLFKDIELDALFYGDNKDFFLKYLQKHRSNNQFFLIKEVKSGLIKIYQYGKLYCNLTNYTKAQCFANLLCCKRLSNTLINAEKAFNIICDNKINVDMPGFDRFMKSEPLVEENLERPSKCIVDKIPEKKKTESVEEKTTEIRLTDNEKCLLECDKIRFNYRMYDKDRLYDLGSGHWDLFEKDNCFNTYRNNSGFVARNPNLDIRKNGIIAIDFGTKSTVVVYQDGNTTKIPLKIGKNDFNTINSNDKDFENPTILEFIDIRSFLKKYKISIGRPETRWVDLKAAKSALLERNDNISNFNEHYAYFSELKQWADNQSKVVIEDKKGYKPELDSFVSGISDINLIELYAYFIGMRINNMDNGIFLDYRLSYPVSFEKTVCDKIRESFEKGIKKSIPTTVQNSAFFAKKFKVKLIAPEPTAYAVCAFQQSDGIDDVQSGKAMFYGVFDFGGGTSDFDFGYWKENDDEDSHYTYDIHRITSLGDRYLGGENLLLMMAYEVFKDNLEILRNNNIIFSKPEFCERFKNDEHIVAYPPNRISDHNMYLLKEELRNFWESEYNSSNQENTKNISLDLLNRHGDAINNNLQIKVDYAKLYSLLVSRIEKGIEQFASGWDKAWGFFTEGQKESFVEKTKYIFLAGNSCKCPVVTDLMEKYYQNEISEGRIKIIKPLQLETPKDNQIFAPNGKTGVAWGLLDIGDSVKFYDNHLSKNNEREFKYYLGIGKGRKFIIKLRPTDDYNKWQKIVRADQEGINIYFTDDTSAEKDNFSIDSPNVKYFSFNVEKPNDNSYVYARIVGSSKVEIVVKDNYFGNSSTDVVICEDKIELQASNEFKPEEFDLKLI